MRIRLWLPALIAGLFGLPAHAVDCAAWNTWGFDWSSSAVQTYLAAGANACDEDDSTPLHFDAPQNPRRVLLSAGASIT